MENPSSGKDEQECLTCPAGNYAPKVLYYSQWDDITSFMNSCVGFAGHNCVQSRGWTHSETMFKSNKATEVQELILSKVVTIEEDDGYIQFTYSLSEVAESPSFMIFSIDGNSIGQYRVNTESTVSPRSYVARGQRLLEWKFHYEPSDAEAQIHSIEIHGTGHGGAVNCRPCPTSQISAEASSHCAPCSAGSSANESATECIPCDEHTYNSGRGSKVGCIPCPENTSPNHNNTMCIGNESLTFDTEVFSIQNITGITTGVEGYSSGICTRKKLELYCHDTFYGPIPGHDNFFYLSLLNPSVPNLPNYYRYDNTTWPYYAIGVLDSEQFHIDPNQFQRNTECKREKNKVMINLGSIVQSVDRTDNGIIISYAEGSECEMGRYSTIINVVCDKTESYGWPVFDSFEDCTAKFTWKSKYGCPLCLDTELDKIEGKCKEGQKIVTFVESEHCIANVTGKFTEDCSETAELFQVWQVLLGVGVLIALVVLFVIIFCCFCRVKSQYERLATECDESELEMAEMS